MMNNTLDRADAMNLFHEYDKAMNFEKPRQAARKTFKAIFDSLEKDYIDVIGEVKELPNNGDKDK